MVEAERAVKEEMVMEGAAKGRAAAVEVVGGTAAAGRGPEAGKVGRAEERGAATAVEEAKGVMANSAGAVRTATELVVAEGEVEVMAGDLVGAEMAVAGMVVAERAMAGATAVTRSVSGAAVPAMAMVMAVAAEGEAGTEGAAGTVMERMRETLRMTR